MDLILNSGQLKADLLLRGITGDAAEGGLSLLLPGGIPVRCPAAPGLGEGYLLDRRNDGWWLRRGKTRYPVALATPPDWTREVADWAEYANGWLHLTPGKGEEALAGLEKLAASPPPEWEGFHARVEKADEDAFRACLRAIRTVPGLLTSLQVAGRDRERPQPLLEHCPVYSVLWDATPLVESFTSDPAAEPSDATELLSRHLENLWKYWPKSTVTVLFNPSHTNLSFVKESLATVVAYDAVPALRTTPPAEAPSLDAAFEILLETAFTLGSLGRRHRYLPPKNAHPLADRLLFPWDHSWLCGEDWRNRYFTAEQGLLVWQREKIREVRRKSYLFAWGKRY